MPFDKTTLTPAQREAYDQLVSNLKAAESHTDQQTARIVAMIPGAGDLMYVPGAMAAAEKEAGLWFSTEELEAHAKSIGTGIGPIRYDPLAAFK